MENNIFLQKNYRIVYGKNIYSKDGPFAGSPEQRANDIHTMFLDPSIDAILCARGGYGANKVIPLLNYELIKISIIKITYFSINSFLTNITELINNRI